MLEKMKNLVVEEEGQALTEYGLIIALVGIACIAVLGYLGDELFNKLKVVKDAIKNS
ncbi:Flp family type IVb pilin [Neobacillus sp. Marseille-QA0830]